MSKAVNNQDFAKLIAISILVAIVILVFIYALFPRPTGQTLLADEFPSAYLLYNGLSLNMDEAPEETFWLCRGLGFSIDSPEARDGKGRKVKQAFDLLLERWQARDISLELGIYMEPGTEGLTFLVNGREVITKPTTPGYQVLTFKLPDEDLIPGNNIVTVQVNGATQETLLDYVRWHLGTSDITAKPELDQRLIDGNEISVIGSAGPCEMNYYVSAPPPVATATNHRA